MKFNSICSKVYSKKYITLCLVILTMGIVLGSLYLIFSIKDDNSVALYLSSYLKNIASGTSNKDLFLNSLYNNLKVFTVIFVFSYLKNGVYPLFLVDLIKGFATGFTISAMLTYCSGKSFFSMVFPIIGIIFYNLTFVFFISNSINYCKNKNNHNDRKKIRHILLSICYLAIFCISSFYDGYISTTFMKMILIKIS